MIKLRGGKYSTLALWATVAMAAGCSKGKDQQPNQVPPPTADFSLKIATITLPGEARVEFTNASANANTYEWNFGNGTTSDSANPKLSFYRAGTYHVRLIAKSDQDADTLIKDVVINVDNSIVAHYPFNGNTRDAAGNAHATAFNIAAAPDRKQQPNGAYAFNGTSSWIKLPDSLIYHTGSGITASLWFQTDNPETSGGIMGYQGHEVLPNPVSNGGFVPSIYVGTNKKLYAKFWFGSLPMSSGEELNTNWHHLVLTGDATGQELYIDGVSKGSSTDIVDNTTYKMVYNQLGLCYGSGAWLAIPQIDNWFYFKGKMDDVRFYNRKLTSAEVTALYNN